MHQAHNTKLRDPWLTASLLFFSASLVAAVFFRDTMRHPDALAGLSLVGLLLAWVYSTLPEDQNAATAKNAYTAPGGKSGKPAAKPASAPGGKNGKPEAKPASALIRSAFRLLAMLSFAVMAVSYILYEYVGIAGCVPLVLMASAGVFGMTFWGSVLWDGFFSPMAGCSPWWWGV